MALTQPSPAPQPPADQVDDDRPKLDLKPTQLAGGALAAVTAAVAASSFGVTGTVVGAAFGSVVSSVAAALYANSLTRAGRRIRTVVVAPVGARGGGIGTADPADPTAVPGGLTGARSLVVNDTMLEPNGLAWPPPQPSHQQPPHQQPPAGWTPQPGRAPGPAAGRSRRFAKPVLVVAGFAFAASIGAISATELALGHPIARSNETGTSFGRVVTGDTTTREDQPSTTPSSDSGPPSSSATQSGSPSPSPSDSGSPSPQDTGSASPTDPAATGGAVGGNGAGAPNGGSTGAPQPPADGAATSPSAAPAP